MASANSNVVASMLGVSWSSAQVNLPPVDIVAWGHSFFPSPHSATSISCTPWLPTSPLPVSQNQCQLYMYRFLVKGRIGAGPRKRSQSTPAGTGSEGVVPIEKRLRKQSPRSEERRVGKEGR